MNIIFRPINLGASALKLEKGNHQRLFIGFIFKIIWDGLPKQGYHGS